MIRTHDMERRYLEFLNELYGTVSVCGYEYEAGDLLAAIDPVAFRCGFADWIDAEITDGRYREVDGGYEEGGEE